MAAPTTAPSAAPSVNGVGFKIAFVVSGNLGDKGFFDSAEAGIVQTTTDFGTTEKTLQASPTDPAQWLQNLQSVSDGSYNVVVAGSTQQHDNMVQVSKDHPNQHYIQFDDQVQAPNVLSIEYKQNEGSYVAGVLAGIVTTDTKDFPKSAGNKKVGLVGGMDIPVINDFVVGFKAGVAAVDPTIQVIVSYIGNFTDANKAYNLTEAMYQQGADIVFAVAGGAGLGVLKASNDSDTYSIGVDSNQNDLYPGHVIASMVKQVGNTLYAAIQQAIQGDAPWGTLISAGLQQKAVGLILDTKSVPQSVQDQINAAVQKVVSGAVTVPTAIVNATPSPS
jgi:basic membrane protein A